MVVGRYGGRPGGLRGGDVSVSVSVYMVNQSGGVGEGKVDGYSMICSSGLKLYRKSNRSPTSSIGLMLSRTDANC